jgi:molybdate transport repressor ModE-like protein
VKLVESAAGGAGGGGSRLTAEGRRLIDMYERFRRNAETGLARDFTRVFEGDSA